MPRSGQVRVPPGQRLSDRVALGVLTATFPRALVDEVIEATGRREQRNRLLPAHLVTYYVMAMTLFSSSGYEEVMRSLTEGLSWASDGQEAYEMPSQVAISKARARLGSKPLAELFTRACVPMATEDTPGGFYRGWRLVSIDGTTIDVADTPVNGEVFGRAGTGRGEGSAFPQLRIVALGECGTHAIIAAAMDSYDVGEVTLAKRMVSALTPGMLVLADRGFTAHPLFAAAADTGADLLWRAKTNAVLPVLERLPDGSFRSELVATADKRTREHVQGVRVVEYAIDDAGRAGASGARYRQTGREPLDSSGLPPRLFHKRLLSVARLAKRSTEVRGLRSRAITAPSSLLRPSPSQCAASGTLAFGFRPRRTPVPTVSSGATTRLVPEFHTRAR